jgi:glycerol transport system ATP-binding protein
MSLTLEGVTKMVGSEAQLSDVSLSLEHGSLSVLLGPTLSGKTSLMRLMAGLDKPTAGRVLFDGIDVTGVPVGRRNVAMVYQQFINYPTLSVYENIASPLRVAGRPRQEIQRRVAEAAALLKLDGLLDRTPLELSGGQQQSTAIARALVKNAGLVLLDEPLANLDYKLHEELREELPKIFAASARSSSMPRPSRRRRFSSAATRRRCIRAALPNSDRRSRSIAVPSTASRPRCSRIRR